MKIYKTLSCPCLNVLIICIKVEYWIVDPPKNKFFNTCTSCCTLHSPLTWMSVRCKSLKLWIFWTEWVWEGGSDWYWGETASKQNTGRTESPLPYPSPETFLLSLDRELIQCKGKLCTTYKFTDPQIKDIVLTAGINDIC